MAGALCLACLAALAYLRVPRTVLLVILVLLLFQDLLVALLGGRDAVLGSVAQAMDEAFTLAMPAAAILRCRLRGVPPRWSAWTRWYGAFAIAAAISTGFAAAGWLRWSVGLLLLSKGPAFSFAVDQLKWGVESARRTAHVVIASAIAFAVFAPLDLLAPTQFRSVIGFSTDIDFRGGVASVVSLAGHPGGYAWMVVSGALLATAALLEEARGRRILTVIALIAASALSMRRKPVLGLIAAIVISAPVLMRGGSRRTVAVAVGLIAAIIVPLVVLLAPVLASGFAGYLGEGAALVQARTALYAGAGLLAVEHFPLGVGVGRYGSYGSIVDYSDVYYRFGFDAIDGMSPARPNFIQDTFWPQILGETGVLGLILYAGMLVVILKAVWKTARLSVGPNRAFAIGAIFVMIETALESVAAPTYTTASQACLALGLARIAVAVSRPLAASDVTGIS